MRLDVLTQSSSHSCVICNAVVDLTRLSLNARINVFIVRNIYIPENVRSCEHHLDDNGRIFQFLLPALRSVNRPYIIRGRQLQDFLQALRSVASNVRDFSDVHSFEDSDFQCITSLSKDQFQKLFTFCDPVEQAGGSRYVHRKDLITFLCKLRQGLSDDFLKVIFHYSTRHKQLA